MSNLILLAIFIVVTLSINVFLVVRMRRKQIILARRERPKQSLLSRLRLIIFVDVLIVICVTITIRIIYIQQPDQPPTPPPIDKPEKKVAELRDKLRTEYTGDGFTVEPHLDSEVVRGLKGNYYKVYIKGPALFQEGEYIIDAFDEKYSRPLRSFADEIVNILKAGNVEYKLFVKGSADIKGSKTFSRDFSIERYTYRDIPYLKYDATQKQFTQEAEPHKITGSYTNRDLPFLRAAFTQDRLDKVSQLLSTVLQGDVTTKIDEKDRNIILMLFVRWPSDLPSQ